MSWQGVSAKDGGLSPSGTHWVITQSRGVSSRNGNTCVKPHLSAVEGHCWERKLSPHLRETPGRKIDTVLKFLTTQRNHVRYSWPSLKPRGHGKGTGCTRPCLVCLSYCRSLTESCRSLHPIHGATSISQLAWDVCDFLSVSIAVYQVDNCGDLYHETQGAQRHG